MTRFLLENVFGSSDLGKAGTPDKQGEELVDEINYLPSVYMIRRVDGLDEIKFKLFRYCLLYTSPSPRDATLSRMPSSA